MAEGVIPAIGTAAIPIAEEVIPTKEEIIPIGTGITPMKEGREIIRAEVVPIHLTGVPREEAAREEEIPVPDNRDKVVVRDRVAIPDKVVVPVAAGDLPPWTATK